MGLLLCSLTIYWCLPHAGGGVSGMTKIAANKELSSPRRWGCFPLGQYQAVSVIVFPTQVGVFPTDLDISLDMLSLPHAGGGVSNSGNVGKSMIWSSPRRWGCFLNYRGALNSIIVFPTQVGVFLKRQLASCFGRCLPHAGGGVSPFFCRDFNQWPSSPRRWGCFL